MTEQTQVEPLETWLRGKPYWEQLLWTLCSQSADLSDEQIALCCAHLCDDVGVSLETKPQALPISFDNIYAAAAAPTQGAEPRVSIELITDIRRVNALAKDCALSLGPNLTLLYGRNGSGKSGLARLIANACFSRGQREVLPDLRNQGTANGKAGATFVVRQEKQEKPLELAYELGSHVPMLKRFAVFDEQSVHIHLDQPNKVSFVPAYESAHAN